MGILLPLLVIFSAFLQDPIAGIIDLGSKKRKDFWLNTYNFFSIVENTIGLNPEHIGFLVGKQRKQSVPTVGTIDLGLFFLSNICFVLQGEQQASRRNDTRENENEVRENKYELNV